MHNNESPHLVMHIYMLRIACGLVKKFRFLIRITYLTFDLCTCLTLNTFEVVIEQLTR